MKLEVNIEKLKNIVRVISTNSDLDKCKEALEIVNIILSKNDIRSKIDVINNQPFLIAGNSEIADVLFLSHIDVVPAPKSLFELIVEGDRIFGRGVLDMKGPLMAGLTTVINLPEKIKNRVLFVVTTDEEVGGFQGTEKLLDKFINIKLAIVLDGGSGENLVINQKAPLHVRITHRGVSAHASRPQAGVNSVEMLAKCCLEINSQIQNCSTTKFTGGVSLNKIPDWAEAILDIRISNKIELDLVRIKIGNAVKNWGCGMEEIDKPLFFEVDKNNTQIARFKGLRKCKWAEESGTSDARFLTDKWKIPIIMTSVIGGGAHGNSEWASINSLNKLANDLYKFLITL